MLIIVCGCDRPYGHKANIIKPDGTIHKTVIIKSSFVKRPAVFVTEGGNLRVVDLVLPVGWNVEFIDEVELEYEKTSEHTNYKVY